MADQNSDSQLDKKVKPKRQTEWVQKANRKVDDPTDERKRERMDSWAAAQKADKRWGWTECVKQISTLRKTGEKIVQVGAKYTARAETEEDNGPWNGGCGTQSDVSKNNAWPFPERFVCRTCLTYYKHAVISTTTEVEHQSLHRYPPNSHTCP